MRTIEVLGYQSGGKYYMKVTRFDRTGKPITTHDEAGVDSQEELQNVLKEFQSTMTHYGTRVVILKGDN